MAVGLAQEHSEEIHDYVGTWGAMVCRSVREIGAEPPYLSPAISPRAGAGAGLSAERAAAAQARSSPQHRLFPVVAAQRHPVQLQRSGQLPARPVSQGTAAGAQRLQPNALGVEGRGRQRHGGNTGMGGAGAVGARPPRHQTGAGLMG